MRKIGHTGTLDPDAQGVLVICAGRACKLVDTFIHDDKEYRAVMLLGVRTDTQDTSGTVLSTCDVSVTEDEVEEAVMSFEGGYDQLPPMYSAKKIKGKKLVDLARKGIEVERAPKHVSIDSIRIEKIDLPRVEFTATVGKGTYIRTLCSDIGEKLGCGACMEKLTRTRSGRFKIEDALTLKQLEALRDDGRLEEVMDTRGIPEPLQ